MPDSGTDEEVWPPSVTSAGLERLTRYRGLSSANLTDFDSGVEVSVAWVNVMLCTCLLDDTTLVDLSKSVFVEKRQYSCFGRAFSAKETEDG